MLREKNKLKIRIESKSSEIPEERTKGRNASYLDMDNSSGVWAHSLIALAESKENSPIACNKVLSIIQHAFQSNFFSGASPDIKEQDFFHLKASNLFTEINSKLVAMRNQGKFTEASLVLGLQRKNTMYLALSGSLNVLLIRNSILYNLALKDDLFEPIKVNIFKKNENFINLGTTIIPIVNTYKVQIEPGDILLFVSNGITENLSDREILLNFCITENFDENFNNLIEKAIAKNQEKNVTAIALTAQPTELPQRQFSNSSPIKNLASGSILAELQPEVPPILKEGRKDDSSTDLEMYRGNKDFYNTSSDVKKEKTSNLKITIPELSQEAKMGILAITTILIVFIGFTILYFHPALTEPVYNSNWKIYSSIKLKEVSLNKNKIKIDSRTIIQKIRSDTLAEMTIKLEKRKNLFYNSTLTLYTKNPIKMTSDQSMSSIDYNTITLEKDQLTINTNLCTTINRKDFSIKEKDTNKNEYYRTTLNLNKMQGDIKIISKSMRMMREIDLAISDSIQ